jgi:CheY-like chemotaxis protein
MAREPILIVDDTPVNLKLTRILLANEGYRVRTAASAEEALDMLRAYHPDLILADIQLPGMDGLEMTRRIKHQASTKDIVVVALTAFAMKGDEEKALAAGCDGYIVKPIDTRTLGATIRKYLEARPKTAVSEPAAANSPESEALSSSEMEELRHRFLEEGRERVQLTLAALDGAFDPAVSARYVHQWIGAGGLLGYYAISRLSREVETLLHDRPVDTGQLRESLTNLLTAFTTQRESRTNPVPEAIVRALTGKQVAVVGLPAAEAERLCVGLESAGARPVFFELNTAPHRESVANVELIVTYVHPKSVNSYWLDPASPAGGKPTVFVGERDHLLGLDPRVQSMARELLMDAWQPEEALVRLSLALGQVQVVGAKSRASVASGSKIRALVAENDPTLLALVHAALEDLGMECIAATDGREAIEALRQQRPHVAVLAVDMPGMDGHEVLSAIRKEEIPTRTLLLTSRQQEDDIIRGFSLGADDYVVRPFNPMELVARVQRLLAR